MQMPYLEVDESNVLQDAHFFAVKSAIDAKLNAMFMVLKNELVGLNQRYSQILPPLALSVEGRTYRGENLEGLPWRALDCPRVFAGADMFAFRTLLHWGKHFSFHFLLGGQLHGQYKVALGAAHSHLALAGWTLSQQDSPWDWQLVGDTHRPLATMTETEFNHHCESREWLKLSQIQPLTAFSSIPTLGAQAWESILKTM
jgi:hypothetical protein